MESDLNHLISVISIHYAFLEACKQWEYIKKMKVAKVHPIGYVFTFFSFFDWHHRQTDRLGGQMPWTKYLDMHFSSKSTILHCDCRTTSTLHTYTLLPKYERDHGWPHTIRDLLHYYYLFINPVDWPPIAWWTLRNYGRNANMWNVKREKKWTKCASKKESTLNDHTRSTTCSTRTNINMGSLD